MILAEFHVVFINHIEVLTIIFIWYFELETHGIIFTAGVEGLDTKALDERLGAYDTEASKTYPLIEAEKTDHLRDLLIVINYY